VKDKLARALKAFLAPIRQRRAHFAAQSGYIEQVIYEGTLKTQALANETLLAMKKAMGFTGVWNRISRKARDRMKKQEQEAQ